MPVIEMPFQNQFIGDPLSPEFESYQTAIEYLSKSKEKTVIQNSNPTHAAIALGNIFKNARKYVRIVAGGLNGQISNNGYYLQSLQGLLKNRVPITILLENYPNYESSVFKLLKLYTDSNSPIINILKISDNKEFPIHFTIADDTMFWLEKEKNSYNAYCSFNNIEVPKILNDVFSPLIIGAMNLKP